MSTRVHLIKLAVGPSSSKELQDWQTNYVCEKAAKGENTELIHITRNFPKRADEILNGGSIYWVIKGVIVGRNQIIDLRQMLYGDQPHCGIVYSSDLVRVSPRPRRPFQGWRYFEEIDIPPDLDKEMSDMSDDMLKTLSELGLL